MIISLIGGQAYPLTTSNAHSPISFTDTRIARATFNEIHALDQFFSFRDWGYLSVVSTGDYIKNKNQVFRVDIDRFSATVASLSLNSYTFTATSATQIKVGQAIYGNGIPKGAIVSSVSGVSSPFIVTMNLKTTANATNATIYFSTTGKTATLTSNPPVWNKTTSTGTGMTDGIVTYTYFQDLLSPELNKINQDPPQFYSAEGDVETFRSYFGPWISDSTVFRAPFNNNGTAISQTPPGLDAGTFQSSIDYVLLLRSSLSSGIDNFETIAKFDASQFSNERYYYDYLVEPGMLYRYKLQGAKADGTRGATTALTQQPQIIPDFTGSYLIGAGDVQINFTYNGELTNLKEVKKDAVLETIGGKYPFVVRNSNIGYKQFSFSAIITHISDPTRSLSGLTYSELISSTKTKNNYIDERYEDYILNGSSLFYSENRSRYYTLSQNGLSVLGGSTHADRSYNFIVEKEFRKKVMNWLYDGQPKVFKSDTEGLMLVKLTDVTFEPVKETGRMLYSFSCTMTEVGPTDLDTLVKFGIKKSLYSASDLYVVSNINNFTIEWTRETYLPEGQYFYVYDSINKRYRYYKVVKSGLSGSSAPTEENNDENSSSAYIYTPTPVLDSNFQYIFIGYSIPGRF